MPEALITCTRCKKRTPMSQMGYSPNGEDLVCRTCARPAMVNSGQQQIPSNAATAALRGMGGMNALGMGGAGLRIPAPSRPPLRSPLPSTLLSRSSASPVSSSASKSIRYQCLSCNYTFTRTSRNENTCPYCNRKTLRKEFQLVSDVDEMMGHLGTY